MKSQLFQDAVIRNVEFIGEAANNILRLDREFDKNTLAWSLKQLTE